MRCPNCWREAAESAVFCNHCGTQLQNICANCNTLNPIDSNFCSRCGLSSSLELQEAEAPAYQKPQVSSPIHSTSCPRCHKINEPGSAYCYSCGLPLDEIPDSPQPSTMQSPQYAAQTPAEVPHSSQAYAGQPAGFWIRLVAALIDAVIVVLFSLLLAGVLPGVSISDYITNFSLDWEAEATTPIWFDILDLGMNAMYFAVLVSVWAATIGKSVFGLRVLRPDGGKVGFGRALARWACYLLSIITLGIGFLMIAFRKDKRGLHDLICDTMVIRR